MYNVCPMLGKDYNDERFLTVSEAAAFLGVSPKTLRRWDEAGFLIPVRHPLTKYRLYKKSQLIDFIKAVTVESKISEREPRRSRMEITDTDISCFLDERVNLAKVKVDEYRAQINHLIENFDDYLKQHEDFGLKKMLHFGSCAKGTAISSTSDLDVAVYLTPDKESEPLDTTLQYIRGLLSEAMQKYGMSDDQFTVGNHCVCVVFKGSKIEVDVVPIIPIKEHSENDWGWLMHKNSSERLKTSIPLHLKFIRRRKEAFDKYSALVRLTKWWKSIRDIPIKSFAIELIWAHLVDNEAIPDSFCDGFPYFFKYVLTTGLREKIIFSDYYSPSKVSTITNDLVKIYDPVNPANNVTGFINKADYDTIIKSAQEAMNILMMATCAPSKNKAIEQWQRIFGTSFNPYNL